MEEAIKIVTPQSAQAPTPNVQEIAAVGPVIPENSGDPEATKLYDEREKPREGVLPGNQFDQLHGLVLAKSLDVSFLGAMAMPKLSADDAALLEMLF